VEPPLQLTLALGPTVTVQVDMLPQAREQDCPQLPIHSFLSAQARLQLLPLQPPCERSQLLPDGQAQLAPVHEGACADWQPTSATKAIPQRHIVSFFIVIMFASHSLGSEVSDP
jgi:hypothetical protein